MNDQALMARAIELSLLGSTAPNPHVGCVIAVNGEIVGEGYHERAGGDHAEVAALKMAGERARGGTAYVTLEPCNHQGRTGPCTEAMIAAGVMRLVYAVADPNPRAAGGAERMRAAGLQVEHGLLAAEAEAANEAWLTAVRRGRPWVRLKVAASMDGRIALPSSESKWITGEKIRQRMHRLRAESAAIVVGRRTVEVDDPLLTPRGEGLGGITPLRVVLDPSSKLDTARYRVFGADAPTLHVTGETHIQDLLDDLFERGLTSVLVEGGAVTHRSFLEADCVDEIVLCLGNVILGDGPSWVSGLDLESLGEASRWRLESTEAIDNDCLIKFRRQTS
ncbi:MAG: bifunctional diaminohydroxyphosphoribosylaminopyrimidine deaminase/5-amino-6-(5-phosphoribosylamino)uracil reductase RibD [Armatimonadetes bacterium]|nr:bifunctional diaminohydroxyphosphoribosylaminopyrimidine deaminase/5-amino-6-(5-phosphoribosylamino)uracil reductase RibD [Armatimonadota bacterium]